MFGEEHAGSALRAVRPLPRNAIPVDLVEPSLEAGRSLCFLRFGHHLPPFFFGSAFFSSFFSSFFSAGFFSSFDAAFFSSLGAGFDSSLAGGFSAFGSALWIALNETSVLLISGFSLLWITSSCIVTDPSVAGRPGPGTSRHRRPARPRRPGSAGRIAPPRTRAPGRCRPGPEGPLRLGLRRVPAPST